MRILFYTSDRRSAIDAYNIQRLIHARPDHTYALVCVRNRTEPLTIWTTFKRRVVELRDGPNHMQRVLDTLDRIVRSRCPSVDLSRLPTTVVERVNDEKSIQAITAFAPDLIIQSGAGILGPEVFHAARIATINVHHGLAPEVRGMRSTFWCLYYGLDHLIGVTCHKIDATLDTGEVIHQERIPYQPGDTYTELQLALCWKGADLLIRSVDDIARPKNGGALRTEVDSYYFGDFDPDRFNALHRNGYKPLADASELRTKRKMKLQMIAV